METLGNALKKVVSQFGSDVLSDMKLINMLSDYRAFDSLPAAKNILKDMIMNGHCQTICSLGKTRKTFFFLRNNKTVAKPEGKEWKIKLASLATSIVRQKGFEKRLVVYVIDCIIFAMQWTDVDPATPQILQRASRTAKSVNTKPLSQPKPVDSNTNLTAPVSYHNIADTQFVVMKISPVDAEVCIDGVQQMVTNGILAIDLPLGSHTYIVKAKSYKSQEGSFFLSEDENTELEITLKLDEQTVKVIITAEDADAEIFINGSSRGKGKWIGFVEKGIIDIECFKPYYYPYKEKRQLGIGKQQFIRIPALKPSAFGKLRVNVQPYGSEVFINGVYKGKTPVMINSIPVGSNTVRVKSLWGQEYSSSVVIRQGQVTTLII